MKYKVRRLIAAIFIVVALTIFTSVVIKKSNEVLINAIDAEFARQDAVLEEHWELWGGK